MAPESWEKQQVERQAKAVLRGWTSRRQKQQKTEMGRAARQCRTTSAKVRKKGPQVAEGMERCRAERGLSS